MPSMGIGFIGILASTIGFGTSFIPAKKIDTGDGVFFQWMQCSAIFMVGFIVQLIRGSPAFEPLAVIGGMLWCTGNALCPMIVQLVGMGLGMLLWGGSSLITGWASGRFGILGVSKQDVNYPVMNAIGVVICITALVIMFFIKNEPLDDEPVQQKSITTSNEISIPIEKSIHSKTSSEIPSTTSSTPCSSIELTIHDETMKCTSIDSIQHETHDDASQTTMEETPKSWIHSFNPATQRLMGCIMAICAGLLFGLNFNPSQHLMDEAKNDPTSNHSNNAWDYVFSHFMGVYFSSTFYFIMYSIMKKNKPMVSSELCLRGILSGFIWSIGQLGYFVANQELSFVITFPINSTVPGMVASLIGIVVYKEITGRRNIMILSSAIMVAIVGVVLIALSKIL